MKESPPSNTIFFGPHFGHVHVDALADPATGPDELQAGPDPHGLRHVGGRRAGGARRRLSGALIRMRRAWEMTRLTSGSPCRGNLSLAVWSASAKDCSRGSSTRSQVRKSKMPGRSSCSP